MNKTDKVVSSIYDAVSDIPDGAVIMVGGFGLCGLPEALIEGVLQRKVVGITLIANNPKGGLTEWIKCGLVNRVVCSYIGNNEALHHAIEIGQVDLQLVPQGTLAERIRAAGAGIPAFYTPTSAYTDISKGKEHRKIDGQLCVLERALHADFALIRAQEVDRFGNCSWWATTQNFQPLMAMAATTTIVEADSLWDTGWFSPEDVHLPGMFIQRIIEVTEHEDAVEFRVTQ